MLVVKKYVWVKVQFFFFKSQASLILFLIIKVWLAENMEVIPFFSRYNLCTVLGVENNN